MNTTDYLNLFFDALPEAAYVMDADFSILHMNKTAHQLHQVGEGEATGKKCHELFDNLELCQKCPLDEVIRTGKPVEKELFRLQEQSWYLLKVFPIESIYGEISIIGAVAKDITSIKAAEQILDDYNHTVKKFIDRMPIGCILWDKDFNVALWNPAAEKIFDFTEIEARGRHPYELIVPPDMIPGTEAVKQQLAKGYDSSHWNGENITKDGSRIFCRWHNTPVQGNDGEVIAVLSMVQDITQEKELQKETLRSAQLASIGQLAASVAHEVNNPINGIINYAQMLLNGNKLDKEIIQRIKKEGIRIENVVRNLLTYARDTGNQRDSFDIRDIVIESLSILDMAFKKEGVPVNFDWADSLPEINCNFQQVEQVLINILRNAYQALSDNDPDDRKINISGKIETVENREYLQLTIANNGPHIPPEVLSEILKPFVSTKSDRGGTGLGLSIASTIMEEHDGKLMARSVPGGLTEMALFFPIDEQAKSSK